MVPVPDLSSFVGVGVAAYSAIQNVKLYKKQCGHLCARCTQLRSTLQECAQGMEGTFIIDIADELDVVLARINRQMLDWGSWNRLRSFLQQGDIKDGVDRMNRDLDYCMMRFHVQIGMEINRSHLIIQATQQRDNSEVLEKIVKVHDDLNRFMKDRGQVDLLAIQKEDELEIRQVLQTILKDENDMKALLDEPAPAVEEMMGTLQTQLLTAELQPSEEEEFKAALWDLHEKTARLPPLTDLTGQITLTSQEPVSTGSSNKIFQGLWLGQQKVALRLPRASDNSPMANERFKREVTMWRGLHHTNVVPLYGTVKIEENVYSVTPWMDHGILSEYVRKDLSVDRLKLLSEIASGLEYLHKHGIIHGDLRGDNVLVSTGGEACLSDFGLTKIFEDVTDPLEPGQTSSFSSLRWTAPEVFTQDGAVSRYSDTWSFGMVCLEILSVQVPFYGKDDKTVLRLLSSWKHPDRPSNMQTGLHNEIWEMMLKCWAKNPRSRLAMSDVTTFLEKFRSFELPPEQPPTILRRLTGLGRRTSTFGNPQAVPIRPTLDIPGSSTQSGEHLQRPTTMSSTSSGYPSTLSSSVYTSTSQSTSGNPTLSPITPSTGRISTMESLSPAIQASYTLPTENNRSILGGTMSGSPPEHKPVDSRTISTTAGSSSVTYSYSRTLINRNIPQRPGGGSPVVDPGFFRRYSNASSSSARPGGGRPAHRRNATEPSAPIGSTGFPPMSPSSLTISTSGSSSSYSSNEAPRLELDFFLTSPGGIREAEGLLHGLALSSRSRFSGESNLRHLGAIQEATMSPHAILNIVDDVVESGTLEGLIQHLIERFDSRKHATYRDIFLMSCAEFTTADELFQIIERHFFDAEDDLNAEARVGIQFNTFLVLEHWLNLGYFAPTQELLYRMKFFGEKALKLKSSVTLLQRINMLLGIIEDKLSEQRVSPHSLLEPRGRILQSSDLEPRGLAIALSLLEGDNYKALQPSDYIVHFSHKQSANICKLYDTNKKIISWVIESILHYNEVQNRVQVLRFFIHTALDCREMRNFSSTIAIATALRSTEIENLRVTRKALTRTMQGKLSALFDIVDPEYNHRRYRDALVTAATPQERDVCIPWLEIHLKELEKVLQQNYPTVEVDGRHLINFRRYIRFMDRINEVIHYSPPNLDDRRHEGQLGYLLGKLSSVDTSDPSKEQRLERSISLMEKEATDHRSRRDQLRHLGFDVS